MSISIPGADYTPQLTGYTGQGAFRFWCQKVLPLVYDDSLSYYELLNKVVVYLNNVISDVATVEDNVQDLSKAYDSLQAYVNLHVQEIANVVNQLESYMDNYFNNLDVQEEINAKLDSMASDGSLSNILRPIISDEAPGIITDWLDKNITPTEPVIDASLTVSGAGADAKVVGDLFNNNRTALRFVGNGVLDLGTLLDDTYIQSSDGQAAHWEDRTATDFLPCFMANKLITHITATNPFAENAFYDKNKTFISSFQVQAGENVLNVPQNAFYVRFSNNTEYMPSLSVNWKTSDVENWTEDSKKAIRFVSTGELDLGTLLTDTYIQSSDGKAAYWEGRKATEFLPCFMADELITYIVATNAFAENAFYDKTKAFISSFQVQPGENALSVPSNAYYVRFSNSNEYVGTLTVKWHTIATDNWVEDSKEAIKFVGNGTLDLGALLTDTYIQSSNGAAAPWPGNSATDFLPCFMADKLLTYIRASNPYAENAFYTKDKTFINSFQVFPGERVLSVPANAYYVRFSNISSNMSTLAVKWYTQDLLNWKSTITVAPYGQSDFDVYNIDETIVVDCAIYNIYADKIWKMCKQANPILTVPHDQFAVYDDSATQVVVKTYDEIKAMTGKYSVLFYNSHGKMCGPFEEYRNRVDKNKSYPSYYDSHVKGKLDAINMQLAGISSGDGFVFITDIHYPNNQMYSPNLIHDICNKTAISKVILNGDYINVEVGNKANALMQINRVCSLYNYADIDTYRVVGNHEFNNPGNAQDQEHLSGEMTPEELRFSILNPVRNKAVIDPLSLSYYWDNEEQKIRYFAGAVTKTSGTVPDSIRWIGRQVESVPDGWGVVIFQHTVLSAAGGSVHPVNDYLTGLFNAMKAKTSFDYFGTVFDYTGKTFEFIACFCGDYHLDMEYTTTDGALVVATTCDAMLQEGNLQRVKGAYTEQAFDVVTINRTTKKICMNRIGAGVDREYTY